MMLVGEAHVCDLREELIQAGGIMAVLGTDHFQRIWLGKGEAKDFQLVRLRARDGTTFAMGRIRFHVDDKVAESEDRKSVVQAALGPEMDEVHVQDLLSCLISTAVREFGITQIHEAPVEGDLDKFYEVLRGCMEHLGWTYEGVEGTLEDPDSQ